MYKGKMSGKKWVPLVMSSSLVASVFWGAGAYASAQELDPKERAMAVVQADKQDQKNHGQEVSNAARNTDGGPEKGAVVSAAARQHDSKTPDQTDAVAEKEQATSSMPADENKDTWLENTYKEIVNDYRSLIDSYQYFIGNRISADEQAKEDTQAGPVAEQASTQTQTPTATSESETASNVADPAPSTEGSAAEATYAAEETAAEETAAEETAAEETAAEGTAEEGTAEEGTAEEGTAEEGTAEEGTAEEGTEAPAGSEQDAHEDGKTDYSVFDKLIGYYQQLVSGFQSFVSLLK